MHSFIIISTSEKALEIANTISPYKIKKDIDSLIIETKESIGIDTVRDIKKFLQVKPYNNSHKIVLIYQADLLTLQAQNSLLKTLEEPPGNSLIFLVTTNENKLIDTVVSRCQIIKGPKPPKDKSSQNSFQPVLESLKGQGEGQRMTMASGYAYPKTKAVSLCQDAISLLESHLHTQPSINTVANLKLASVTLSRLEANVDPRLSIEHFFLKLNSQ